MQSGILGNALGASEFSVLIGPQATTGLIGTIVGFFFGGASRRQQPSNVGGRNQPGKAAGAKSRLGNPDAGNDPQS
jgi:hypothetical protein